MGPENLDPPAGRTRSGAPAAPARPRRRIHPAAAVLLLAGALLVIVLVATERLVVDPETGWPRFQRAPIYVQEPGSERTGHRYLYDPLLGWRNIPGWQATTRGQRLTINSAGLRDREYEPAKPPGTSRLLALGDSFGWGYGVADDEVYTEVLEERLRADGRRWEVWNAAVSGWGTDQEYLYLRDEGFRYAPDVVVLAFFVNNDPENNLSTVQYGLHKPAFRSPSLELVGVPVPEPGTSTPQFTTDADPIDLTLAIVEQMARECGERGATLVVAKFGTFLQPEDARVARWDAAVGARLSDRADLAYLDLDAAFAARGLSVADLSGGNDNGHWNAAGHRATAEILHAFLTRTGLVR